MVPGALETLVRSAVTATGASDGWLSLVWDDTVEVCAYAGVGDPSPWLGARFALADAGTAGMAAATGQPLAVRPRPGDALVSRGPMTILDREPTCYASVPCADDDGVVGVLEVVDKRASTSFDFDDVELLALLSDIAAAMLRELRNSGPLNPVLARIAAEPEAVQSAVASLLDVMGRHP